MLTNAQAARVAEMNAADAANWTAWYTEQNDLAAAAQRNAEKVIVELAAGRAIEPTEARKVAGVAPITFNAAVRYLQRTGAIEIDQAGMIFGWAV